MGFDYESEYSSIVEINGDRYLVQGDSDDEIWMFRDINELLECERDNVQKMMGEQYD